MNFLNSFIPEEYIQALGWTLLHSIWQIAVIALLVGILMIFLQRSSKIRYTVAAFAMPLTLLVAFITFYISFDASKNSPKQFIHSSEEIVVNNTDVIDNDDKFVSSEMAHKPDILSQFKTYFTAHFPLIITIWFLGILIFTLRLLGGLAYVQRLKKYKVTDITSEWESKIKNISRKIGLDKTVRLLESSLVTVPMVVGYFKPVILIPIGAITGLSASQVEAILAHELAHISRKDYLVNIIQTVIEIIFFYHPAIWWLSNRVREERENCCDDIALQVNENTLVYAKALTTLGEMQVNHPGLAMAATGNSGILFKRIKRMLTQPTQNPTFSEGFITACALFICIFCFSFIARASLSSNFYEPAIAETTESLPNYEGEFNAVVLNVRNASGDNDNLIIVKNKKGKIVELYVNGKKVPRSEIKNYEAQIQESLAQQKDQQSIGNSFTSKDEVVINKIIKELDEEPQYKNEDQKTESFRIEKRSSSQRRDNDEELRNFSEEDKTIYRNIFGTESGEIVNSFVQKTLDIARIGMEIGSLNIEMERLKRQMDKPGVDSKKYHEEINRLEKEIASLEAKADKLGEEMENQGEDFGKWSLDFSSSVIDSMKDGFNFNWSDDDDTIGDDAKETRQLSPFKKLNMGGSFNVVLEQGGNESVRLEGRNLDLNKVITEVKNNTLHIFLEKGNFRNFDLTVYVNYKTLEEINKSGSGNLEARSDINASNLKLELSGSGNTNFRSLVANDLKVNLSGSGNLALTGGKAQKLDIQQSG
ncbi:MAG: DUF2807 domain-containing protein, partial [Bacteroidota bacterium]|nr:DUF2807 domain-containing protein [Bacteroidota bacterium]